MGLNEVQEYAGTGKWRPEDQWMEGKNNHIHGEIVIYVMLSHTRLVSLSSQSGEAGIVLCLCYLHTRELRLRVTRFAESIRTGNLGILTLNPGLGHRRSETGCLLRQWGKDFDHGN